MTKRLQIDRLEWDRWNREHITKHNVTPDEAEQVVRALELVEESYKNRYRILGETTDGRILTVIIGENPRQRGHFYVFSAHPASRGERRRLRQARGEDAT